MRRPDANSASIELPDIESQSPSVPEWKAPARLGLTPGSSLVQFPET